MKLKFFDGAKYPFLNLTPTQKFLFALRCGFSLVSIILVIIVGILQKYPKVSTVVNIACGHFELSEGLNELLLNQVETKGWTSATLPSFMALEDSSVGVLEKYIQEQIGAAPQSILLLYKLWCKVEYLTDYSRVDYITANQTTECFPYAVFGFFDYRLIMKANGLEIMTAYASEDTFDKEYMEKTIGRQNRFRSMHFLFYTQALSQGVLLFGGLMAYANRGLSKDLSKFRRTYLHVMAGLAVQALSCIIIATTVIMVDLSRYKKDIADSLGSFGVVMTFGSVFKLLVWLTFVTSFVSSMSWILPVWCSNPPKKGPELVYSGRSFSASSEKPTKDARFVIKPYRARRETTYWAKSSRLFDDDTETDNASTVLTNYKFNDSSETDYFNRDFSHGSHSSEAGQDSPLDTADPAGLSSAPGPRNAPPKKMHSELELRRLGRKITKNAGVRTRRTETLEMDPIYAATKEDTHNLLYGDNQLGNHQYPQAFGRSESMSRGPSVSKRQNSGRTRQLLDANSLSPTAVAESDATSVLNADEVEYMDHNNFVNRL